MNKGTRKNIISTAITLLILAGGIFLFQGLSNQKKSTVSENATKKERRKVQIASFKASEAANSIDLDGRLQAVEKINISSKVGGILQPSGKSLRKGQYIAKGTALFVVDKQEAEFNLKAAKSSLMTSITQMMPDIKFDYPQSFQAWEQYLKNFNVDQSLKAFPESQSDQERYFISGRNLNNQFYSIKSQETRLADYTIYAPFSGIITQINVFPGGLVNAGANLASMMNTGAFEIEAPISLEQLKYIKTGQSVNLRSNELDKSWTGRVSRIGTQIDNTTQSLPIFISVGGQGLKDGMYLTGSLEGNKLQEVIKLPKDVFISPTKIFTVVDSTIVAKEIISIKRLADDVLVTGITEEEKVIVGSLSGLFEGQKVRY